MTAEPLHRLQRPKVLSQWQLWWQQKNLRQRCGAALGVGFWWLALGAAHGLTPDHLVIGAVLLLLAYGGKSSETLLRHLLPAILTVIIYDSMRYYSDLIRSGSIHVQEPYFFDRYFFGVRTDQGLLTPNEWFQKHTHWMLDLVSGFFYLTFVAIFLAISLHFRFILPRKSALPEKLQRRGSDLLWDFFWLNMLGYTTYYWYPAAPPWYVSLHGLGPANLSVAPNPAGAIRFDELLGTHFFTEMYGRSADVFGAIPSLHVAYPLLSLLYALELGSLRAFTVVFYTVMCFSAVYLNHHYVLDILWGSTYTVLVYVFMKRARRQQLF